MINHNPSHQTQDLDLTHLSQPVYIFLTGASGSGKTTLTKDLEQQLPHHETAVFYFDTCGVPCVNDMIQHYGSPEAWQRAATETWVKKMSQIKSAKLIILEGQYNPQFVIDAAHLFALPRANIHFICIYADSATRNRRLFEQRLQAELATEHMQRWSEFLKSKTLELGGDLFDTSTGKGGVDQLSACLIQLIIKRLQKSHARPA